MEVAVTGASSSLVFACVFILSVTTIGSRRSQAGESKGKYADVNGLKMYYEIHGTGEPLVLLHGGIATIDNSFGKLIPGLSKHHRVIALEQQGHGHTRDVDRPLSYEQMAEDTVALLAELKIEKADFFGWSDGAAVGLQIAIKHPQMVRKLAMIGTSYNNDGLEPEVVKGIASLTPEMIPRQFHDDYEKVAPEPGQWAGVVAKIRTMAVEWKGFSPKDLRGIKVPVLVMVGDRDIVRAEHAVEMFRLFPNAQLAVLPGVSHFGVVERSDWVLGMVTAYLDTPR